MVKDIVKDTEELQKPCISVSKKKSPEVSQLIQDMIDTAKFHEEKSDCVGLAANQIGSNLRVAVCKVQGSWEVMINPSILKKLGSVILSEEGCLSLEGTRTVRRHNKVQIMYTSPNRLSYQKRVFSGLEAVIIQHEIDHLNGKLI